MRQSIVWRLHEDAKPLGCSTTTRRMHSIPAMYYRGALMRITKLESFHTEEELKILNAKYKELEEELKKRRFDSIL